MVDRSGLADQMVADEEFIKSSYSGSGSGSDCVEVAPLRGGVRVRDSKHKRGTVLNFGTADFTAFVAAVRKGDALAG